MAIIDEAREAGRRRQTPVDAARTGGLSRGRACVCVCVSIYRYAIHLFLSLYIAFFCLSLCLSTSHLLCLWRNKGRAGARGKRTGQAVRNRSGCLGRAGANLMPGRVAPASLYMQTTASVFFVMSSPLMGSFPFTFLFWPFRHFVTDFPVCWFPKHRV